MKMKNESSSCDIKLIIVLFFLTVQCKTLMNVKCICLLASEDSFFLTRIPRLIKSHVTGKETTANVKVIQSLCTHINQPVIANGARVTNIDITESLQ